MRETELKDVKAQEFKRLTGVRRSTFEAMVAAVEAKSAHFGRPPKLSCGDQVLMTLMYWREYRTEFHIAHTYHVHESTVSRVVRKVETILSQSGQFNLPGKKVLRSNTATSDLVFEVVLVDATEQPIERPKKNNGGITAARKNAMPRKHNS